MPTRPAVSSARLAGSGTPVTGGTTVPMPQPARREQGGRRLTLSYINFAFANGGLIMPSFGDPCDEAAFRIFHSLFPERKIIQLLADDLVIGGGGIHCVTQQEPAV